MPAPQTIHTRPFRNKMIYLGFIIALIFPICWLSQPASENSVGGFLEREQIGTVDIKDLGEINMASETMRLGTFGMDGIVQMMLWLKADEFKKKKNWTLFSATLDQLIDMNPHLESVWRFQGWNLAYNVSVEQDNYRDRYFWVMKGIRYLENGTQFNPFSIRISHDVGWTTTQKMGKSDEHVYFHEFYKNDQDIKPPWFYQQEHPDFQIPDFKTSTRDSWLVGKFWYKHTESLHDKKGVDLQTISPTLFYSYAPLAQAYYADNLEQLGNFNSTAGGSSESAKNAWTQFSNEWKAFGELSLDGAFGEQMKLIEEEYQNKEAERYRKELEDLKPGLYKSLVEGKETKFLSPAERAARKIPMEFRNADEQNIASEADEKVRVSNEEWAQNLPMEKRQKGLELAKKLDLAKDQATLVHRYKNIVNYDYWQIRGELEKTDNILQARELVYEGDKLYENNEVAQAVDNYRQAFSKWSDTITGNEKFHNILDEDLIASDLREMYDKYELIRLQDDPGMRSEEVRKDLPPALKKVLETAPTDTGVVERMKMRHDKNKKRGGYVPGMELPRYE